MKIEAPADHLREPFPAAPGAGRRMQADEAAAPTDEPFERAALRGVKQRFDVTRVRVDDRIVLRQRVVAKYGRVGRRICRKAVFGGHLLQHPRRRRDIFMYIAVAMPGEYEHAFAAQVGRPVVLPFVRARAEQRQRAQ